jgi:hypothetical protein
VTIWLEEEVTEVCFSDYTVMRRDDGKEVSGTILLKGNIYSYQNKPTAKPGAG